MFIYFVLAMDQRQTHGTTATAHHSCSKHFDVLKTNLIVPKEAYDPKQDSEWELYDIHDVGDGNRYLFKGQRRRHLPGPTDKN